MQSPIPQLQVTTRRPEPSPLHSTLLVQYREVVWAFCVSSQGSRATHLTAPSDTFSLADRRTAQTRRCCVPYLTAGVAANVPDELGRGVHRPFISAFTCTSLFPKVEVVQCITAQVEWSVEVLGLFVSSPHATRKCRLLPEAQERGLTFVIRMHRLQPISICKTHGARGRGAIVRRRRRAATAALSADLDMVRRVGSSSGGGVWTWVWKLYVSFATAPLLPLRYICNRPAAPRGQIVTTAQVTRQTRYSNTLVC